MSNSTSAVATCPLSFSEAVDTLAETAWPADPVTAKASNPRLKPVRTVRLVVTPIEGAHGFIEITSGKKATGYFLDAIPADFGRGFRLEKDDDDGCEVYHVNINAIHGHCDCLGNEAHGHCKHVDGIKALLKAGKL